MELLRFIIIVVAITTTNSTKRGIAKDIILVLRHANIALLRISGVFHGKYIRISIAKNCGVFYSDYEACGICVTFL